jgi:ketosteroid isomerase-like protein
MSQENVEVVRRAIEAWNEGGPQSAKRFWAEDFEWNDPPNLPNPRVVRGRDASVAYLTDQRTVVGDLKVTPVDVRDRGEAVVRGCGSASCRRSASSRSTWPLA